MTSVFSHVCYVCIPTGEKPEAQRGTGLAILGFMEASGPGLDFLIFLSRVNTGLSSSERLRKEKSLRVCSSGRRGRDESRMSGEGQLAASVYCGTFGALQGGGWVRGSFKDSPLGLVVYSPHRSGFQETGDGETKGGDTVQLSIL